MSDSVQLLKALADETRLRILHLLCRRELCVCQIVEVLGVGQSKVSRHLAYLRHAGLVRDRRDGLWIHYSLTQGSGALRRHIAEWLTQAEKEIPGALTDLQALEHLRECRDLCPEHSPSRGDERREDVAVVGS